MKGVRIMVFVLAAIGALLLPAIPSAGTLIKFDPHVDYPVGADWQSLSVADLNGDGAPDIITSNFNNGSITILLNHGDGTFVVQPPLLLEFGQPRMVQSGDIDGDGWNDLVVCYLYDEQKVKVLYNQNYTFIDDIWVDRYAVGKAVHDRITAMGLADLNGDGRLDIVSSHIDSSDISVLINQGNRKFQAADNYDIGTHQVSFCFADLDGEYGTDIVIAAGTAVMLLRNFSSGIFSGPYQMYALSDHNPISVCSDDFNSDRTPDLATTNFAANTVQILKGVSYGVFTDVGDYAVNTDPQSITTGDFDGDHNSDLVFAASSSTSISVMRSKGNGGFESPLNFNLAGTVGTLCVADFNHDGSPDIAATCNSSSVRVLINRTKVPTDSPDDRPSGVPSSFQLNQNYPNPFNPSTTISYSLPHGALVTMRIFNETGQEVRSLHFGFQSAGTRSIVWDGTDDHHRLAATGVYLYQLTAGDFVSAKKMTLLK